MMPFDIFYKNNKKKKTNKNLYLELKKKKCYSLFHHMELNLWQKNFGVYYHPNMIGINI